MHQFQRQSRDKSFRFCFCFDETQNEHKTRMIFLQSTIKSSGITTNFIVYQSLSEIGLWRLYYPVTDNKDEKVKFYKGEYDYVQQTMINIRLQFELDKYFYSESTKKSDETYFDMIYNYFNKYIFYPISLTQYCIKYTMHSDGIINHIDNCDRTQIPGPFINEKYNFKCGFLSSYPINLLNEFSAEIEKNYDYSETKAINKIIKNINLDIYTPAVLNGYVFSTKLKHKKNSFECILIFIRYNLKIECTILDESEKMKLYSKNIHDIKTINCYAPVVLIQNESITQYGTYENYILAGAYICKILDYSKQSPIGTPRCSVNYNFIGEMYQNIFPYKNFIPDEIEKLIQEYETFNEHPQMNVDVSDPDVGLMKYLKYKMKYFKI